MLVRQSGSGGVGENTALLPTEHIRAIGDRDFLRDFRDRSAQAVAAQRTEVRRLEAALAEARDAVWIALDAIGATRLGIETAAARGVRRRKAMRTRIERNQGD